MSEQDQTTGTTAPTESTDERERRREGKHYSPISVRWVYRDGASMVVIVDTKAVNDATDAGQDSFGVGELAALTPLAAKVLIDQLKSNTDFAVSMEKLIPAAIEAGARPQDFADAMSTINANRETGSLLGNLFGGGIFG